MKRMLFCMACFLLTSAVVTAQVAPAPKGPRIHADEPQHNFGMADSQTVVEHTFVIRNIGDETLEISNAKPACGCTVAKMSQKSVPPGGTSEITARLSLRGRKGHQSKSITVHSNDPEKPQYQLVLSGDVDDAIAVKPDRLIFGQVAPGQEITLTVELNGTTEQDFQILKIETNNDHLSATVDQPVPGKNHRVTATIRAPEQVGPINGAVRITTDHPNRPSIDVPVAANVVGELVFAPSELVIPANSGDQPLTRYIVVRKGTVQQFEIKDVMLPAESITKRIHPFGDQGYRVQIDNIKATEDLNGKEIIIHTSAENMSEIRIPIAVRP